MKYKIGDEIIVMPWGQSMFDAVGYGPTTETELGGRNEIPYLSRDVFDELSTVTSYGVYPIIDLAAEKHDRNYIYRIKWYSPDLGSQSLYWIPECIIVGLAPGIDDNCVATCEDLMSLMEGGSYEI